MKAVTRLRIGLSELTGALEAPYLILWRLKLDCDAELVEGPDPAVDAQLFQMLARLNSISSEVDCWLEQLGGRL